MERASNDVTKVTEERVLVRGLPIEDLIAGKSFAASIFLLLQGRLPGDEEEKLTSAILVALIDHGLDTPSIHATLAVQRGGNPLNVAVGAGMLAFGDKHGGGLEYAAELFQEAGKMQGSASAVASEIVGMYAGSKMSVPGYGHRTHKTDPRTIALLKKAHDLDLFGRYCEIAVAIEEALAARYRQPLPLNVDGAAAALICELGFDWRLGRAFFILSRSAGTVAHAYEELRQEAPLAPLGNIPWRRGSGGAEGYELGNQNAGDHMNGD
ncbi:citryl-CoA lyase [bacterium]|nr:citryl-CoA lyase [bacterium]